MSAKAGARTLAESHKGSARASLACAFVENVIETYARTIQARSGDRVGLSPCPALVPRAALDRAAIDLGQTLGEAAASLDPTEASYTLSTVYTAMLPPDFRASFGVFYTPPAITARLLSMASEAGVDWSTCRALDPACGGGAFLTPLALRMMKELDDSDPKEIVNSISRRLRGFEIDAFSAWMAQAFLEIALHDVCNAANRRLPQVVHICDSLRQEPTNQYFDLVIGNPPYGRPTIDPEIRERYRRSLFGHANLYGVFTDLALRWTAANGVIAYVTPTSFLAGEYFKALRGLLAEEAPPQAVDFISARKDVFDDVLQETMLATYRRGAKAAAASVHFIGVAGNGGAATITPAGKFELPQDPRSPWLLPRYPDHTALIKRMTAMPHRLKDWGYKVSTGPLVWNRHKDQLRDHPNGNTRPLIWAEAIAAQGQFQFKAEKRNHRPYFELREGDGWLEIDRPCVLLQRTTAKEQCRRLIAAELPKSFISTHGSVVVENHLNMVRPRENAPAKVSPAALAAFLNSSIVDQAFRCISGSVAVSAFELEALPVPSPDQMTSIEALLSEGAGSIELDTEIRALYRGEGK